MGRNAQRRRLPKELRKLANAKHSNQPTPYINLVDYISANWGLDKPVVRRLLQQGKVNVNGDVWAYRDVPKHLIETDQLGRWRIMVEGHEDPRPATGGALLLRGRK